MAINNKVCPPEQAVPALTDWFDSPQGQAVLKSQRSDIDQALACLFGYHLCQISVCRHLNLSASSRIPHTFALNPQAHASASAAAQGEQGACDLRRLPLAPESVDVFVLHHALDFSQTPHQLLAEAARATIARGHIVIVGFNPWSLVGGWHIAKRLTSRQPLWRHQHLRLGRLFDWFALLDLEPVEVRRGHYWPFAREASGRLERGMRSINAPWGSYYMVTVRKDVPGVLPVKPRWKTMDIAALGGVSGKVSGRSMRRSTNPEKREARCEAD
ncbi:methyltransferase domain-containing protein [Gilvimarinus algae]|uniref:Methyltransferase domain-containing protein n=1 Tax=Gilvimarinus algae TaxID=3058037 RepID=A0ABT8TFN4_9GAMM|nr:methyltransferase domain-containing protein [Gilvimarinus sp. SDUM040014]MDO3382329.1 methyltransferase domain-containing protein [Gilvimarinus sp. SDUM040014]